MRRYISAACFALATIVLADSTCYQRRTDQINANPSYVACPNTGTNGFQLCCLNGDLCGQDSLCRSSDVKEGNEWYVGGCTDKSYTDGTCNTDCTSYKQQNAVWNASGNGYWACCGDYDCADGPPTTRRFIAASPTDWKEISKAGSSDSSSGGLSTTVKIIIGVVVGVVVLALIVVVAFFLFRRRRMATRTRSANLVFGRGAKKAYGQIDSQTDVHMQAPFVAGENQPYSRPSSPNPPQLAATYGDGPHFQSGMSRGE